MTTKSGIYTSLAATSVAAAGLLGSRTYRRYRRDIGAARDRIRAAGSRVLETAAGPIEFAEVGAGEPILLSHGVIGGFDHSLAVVPEYLGPGFRALCPSRFGYLRTPLPADPSPAAQADAYAGLLDTLGLGRVAVMGTSAGGPSALQLALRHPGRVSALVLWSMAVPPYGVPAGFAATAMRAFFSSDLL